MICAIVLAAGQSRRMGLQKLLLPFAGKTVIAHIVGQLLTSAIDKIYVVVGCEANRIAEQIYSHSVSVVTNRNYESGMLSSVRCGFEALPQQCEAVLVTLGDQPAITSELVDKMLHSFAKSKKGILVPLYCGKRGHPVLASTHYREEIMTNFDDIGLRGLLHAHPDDIFELNVSTSAVLQDMDYPEDYKRAVDTFENNNGNKTD
jgi:molybdenum cofactor cytidylyltransferase